MFELHNCDRYGHFNAGEKKRGKKDHQWCLLSRQISGIYSLLLYSNQWSTERREGHFSDGENTIWTRLSLSCVWQSI